MDTNKIRIYSIVMTIITVALAAAVVILAVTSGSGRNKSNGSEGKAAAMPAEDAVMETAAGNDPDTGGQTGNATGIGISHGSTGTSGSELEVFNVSGAVGWEAGNDYALNLVNAWTNMLEQLDIDTDIAFLGDSITQRGDFRPYFADKKVVNLGCGGDTIRGVYNRTRMLSYVHPEQVVVMCGVNMLRNDNIEECTVEYAGLLNSIQEQVPDAKVYVMSILPMSQGWQDDYCAHETTEEFNLVIKQLAEMRNMTYVDLYSVFELDGVMNPDLSVDGLHLSSHGYDVWMYELYKYLVR